MLRAVIFDMDGVLVDSEIVYIEQFSDFLNEQGISHDKKDLFALVGSSEKRTIEMLDEISAPKMSGQEVLDTILSNNEKNPVDYAKYLVDGVKEVLAYLKENGYKIALASSSSTENIMHVLHVCGIASYFEVISSGFDFKESKPHPEIYQVTMKKLGVTPRECLVVEDSYYGIKAAKAAGIYTIAREDKMFGIDQSEADLSITDFSDLINIIETREGE